MFQLFKNFSDVSKVEPALVCEALACDAVEYGDIGCNDKGNTEAVVYSFLHG